MSLLAVIEILLLVNMVLFIVVFSLFAQPDSLIEAVMRRIRGGGAPLEQQERAEDLLRKTLHYLGLVSCVLLVGWSLLTGFVITLYREGFFWRF